MNLSRFLNRSMIAFLLLSTSICLSAQDEQIDKNFVPKSGQPGKDVIWVPTPQVVVEKMLDIAKVTPLDFVMDLGSGDGRTVITAAKRGAKAIGLEYNPNMVELSRKNATNEGVSDRAEFIQGDLFEADLSRATVITMFLLPSINLKLRPKILDLKPGTRIVSNSFTMGEWIPDETIMDIDNCDSYCDVLLWIVPAKVEGNWKIPQGELKLSQKFQVVTGTMKTGNRTLTISEGRLNGDQITFKLGDEKYYGHVNGNSIAGTVTSGQDNSMWNATRRGD